MGEIEEQDVMADAPREGVGQRLSRAREAAGLTLAEIASSGATSKNECMLCFNRTVGLSPIQYVKSYRLVRAKELLSSGTLKIAQIAELCGFQDTSYFSKSFREKYGKTPNEYRCQSL